MKLATRESALALRDGGIDAMAALDHALACVLDLAPEEAHTGLKRTFGQAMSAIMDATLLPAVRAYPELQPGEDTWRAAVRERLTERLSTLGATR